MELPVGLFCLNLAYSIDDRDVIEQLLTDFPKETEKCIPIALRQILESANLPDIPFLSAAEIFKYLSLLWQDDSLNNKLVKAASDGLLYLVNYLLNRGANIHWDDDAALRLAVKNGHTSVVKLLIDRGANVHAYSDKEIGYEQFLHGENLDLARISTGALAHAAVNGHTQIVKLLLERGMSLEAMNDALERAAANNRIETAKELLDGGADVHSDNDHPLIWAAENGYLDMVKLLLSRNADVRTLESEALRWAARGGHTEIVRLLLDRNANIHARNDQAVKWAKELCHKSTIALLLQYGANPGE